jgi:hypothetical protein
MIDSPIVQQGTLAAVREYVRDELCEQNQLERDAFEMSQRVLTRKGCPVEYSSVSMVHVVFD